MFAIEMDNLLLYEDRERRMFFEIRSKNDSVTEIKWLLDNLPPKFLIRAGLLLHKVVQKGQPPQDIIELLDYIVKAYNSQG
jgi:hypothetical protein